LPKERTFLKNIFVRKNYRGGEGWTRNNLFIFTQKQHQKPSKEKWVTQGGNPLK